MIGWKLYRKTLLTEARPYVKGESIDGFMVSDVDLLKGSPRAGDMIARYPDRPDEQWLIPEDLFAELYEEAPP